MNLQASTSIGFPRALEKLLTGAALTLALSFAMQGLMDSAAHSEETVTRPAYLSNAIATAPMAAHAPLQDGTYLYGQSAKPGQIGSAYLVFEVKRNNVVGAFYMPHSSFDCFSGNVRNSQMALTVSNSYEKTRYPYSVALQRQTVSASAANPSAPVVGLRGFHSIKSLSAADQRILSTCKMAESSVR